MATDYRFNNAPVKGRNPFGVLGLSIITFGIYYWYWWYQINREMRDSSAGRIPVDPIMSLVAITFGVFILIPPFVSFHKTGRRAQEAGRLAGRPEVLSMWVYWLLYLFTGYGGAIYLQWELNKVWTAMSQAPIVSGQPGPFSN